MQTLLRCPVAPPCAIACIDIGTHVENSKVWQPYHCLDTKILHTLIGMGSAALAAALPYQVRRPEFPARDDEVLINLSCPLASDDEDVPLVEFI